MARLSHLIIVQVVFVFAALVLIFFAPQQNKSVTVSAQGNHVKFSGLVGALAGHVAHWTSDDLTAGQASSNLNHLLAEEPGVLQATVYRFAATGPITLFDYQSDSTAQNSLLEDNTQLPLVCVRSGDGPVPAPWPVFPVELTEDRIMFGAPLTFADGTDGMLVVTGKHDLFLSDRSTLTYALLLLFLCAALVALLTVYLIHRHFTQPFRRMIHGFEKTSDGELYYLMENSGEEELSRLETVFNKLSRNLLTGHKQLVQYDEQLRDTSDSLEKSRRLLSTVIDNSPVGVVTTNPTGRILLFNRKASELFGYDEADALGRPIDELFASDVEERAKRHEGEADECGLEVVGRRTDGSQFAAFLITSTLRNEQQECIGYVYIVRDISQSKDFQQMMIRLDRYYTRGEMCGEIAHEINNYLSILMGNIELVPLILKKGNMERLDQKLELMHGTVEKIARLTDGLLDSAGEEIRFDRCDINQLIQGVIGFLKPQNKFDNTEVIADLSSDVPLVQIDPGLLYQVMVNLVYNAGEAVYDIDCERRVRIGTALVPGAQAPTLAISVHDNGPGVSGEKLPLLFRKRFTTKRRGHGIGLITCRKIVEAHNGRIAYTYADGALFTITVPVDHVDQLADDAGSAPQAAVDHPAANF